MRSKRLDLIRVAVNSTVALLLASIVYMEYVRPEIAVWRFEESFKSLALECDFAMTDEAAIASSTADEPRQHLLQKSADVGLLTCHAYDKLRKTMLISGVSEAQLALMGLEALEKEGVTVSRMVAPHRMERF